MRIRHSRSRWSGGWGVGGGGDFLAGIREEVSKPELLWKEEGRARSRAGWKKDKKFSFYLEDYDYNFDETPSTKIYTKIKFKTGF